MDIIQNKQIINNKDDEVNILTNSIYNICGCCSIKERSRSTAKRTNENVFEIEEWLININMIKYKQNFIENGYDKFEYFFLQMFGSFPIDSNLLKNWIGIKNDKDRDLILLQLQKDVKYLSMKTKNRRNFSIPKFVKHDIKDTKKTEYSDCIIF